MSDAALPDPWADACTAAALFAVDPAGLGIAVRAPAGPVRDRWLAHLRAALPAAAFRRLPPGIADARLLGGLDLTATLRAGKPVAERGVLAEIDGGVLVLAMAERLPPATAARLNAVLDAGAVVGARDGIRFDSPTCFGVIALDEGIADDERPPASLLDRLAIHLDVSAIAPREAVAAAPPGDIAAARGRLAQVGADDAILSALCGTALALGVDSCRAPLLALRAARAAAALAGHDAVTLEHAAVAARLVLAPRATRLPSAEPPPPQPESDPPPPPENQEQQPESQASAEPPGDLLLAAAQAAIPAGLLALLANPGPKLRARSHGRFGAPVSAGQRGRPAGVRAGDPRGGARLSVIETLRAAAPWQRLRRQNAGDHDRIEIRKADFRVVQRKQRSETTTIFVVDASGSSALNRLAEAKGAVELLLADCYVRRDRVAVLAFRNRGADLLLPPTRSLVRAKRSLAGLPGGGGTPLAAGIDAAVLLADGVRRRGGTPAIVLLTDGRANVARDGSGGRAKAESDALAAARQMRASELSGLLIDTAPRPQKPAENLAAAMGARYLPLPYANAAVLSQAVRAASPTVRAPART